MTQKPIPQILSISDSNGFISRLRKFCADRSMSMSKFVRLCVIEGMERTLAREEKLDRDQRK